MHIFYLALIIHFIIGALSYASFAPNTSTKNKSYSQIIADEKYAKLFNKNFPYLAKYSWIYIAVPFIYHMIYFWLSRIDYTEQNLRISTIIFIIIISLGYMFIQTINVSNEYQTRDKEMRNKKPFIIIGIFIFIYCTSVLSGLTTVHFFNYALDFSTGEENIVTIINSEHYITRGTKGGTTHHYKISFEPSVGGHYYLEVPSSLQARAKPKDQLKLYVKNGFFGMPYISSKKILLD